MAAKRFRDPATLMRNCRIAVPSHIIARLAHSHNLLFVITLKLHAGPRLGGAENISEPDQYIDALTPRFAIDGAGTAWAAWSQRKATNNVPRVFVNRFE